MVDIIIPSYDDFISAWPSIGWLGNASHVSIFFPEAWTFPDHYIVTVKFNCRPCQRQLVFGGKILRVKQLDTYKQFGCQDCKNAIEKRIHPLNVHPLGKI